MSTGVAFGAGQDPPVLRESLFGILNFDRWLQHAPGDCAPWNAFAMARACIARSEQAQAITCLREITNADNLETRHYLQAWYFLRQLGHKPPPELAGTVLGVVVEMGFALGNDLLAAYANHQARYVNYSGKAIFWDRPNASLDEMIDALLLDGSRIARHLGIPAEEALSAVHPQHTRISFLTAGGLYYGQGRTAAFSKNATSRKILGTATTLLQSLLAVCPQAAAVGH